MGRKPGSLNRRTRALWPMLEALGHRDPAVVLAEIASMPFDRLKKMANSDQARAALAAKVKAAAELMPYLHSKMPVKIDANVELPVFNLFGDRNQLEQNQGDSTKVIDHVTRPVLSRQGDLLETVQQSEGDADD